MNGEGIKEIERLVEEAQTVDVDGVKFTARNLKPVQDRTEIDSIELSTLTGLKDYVIANIEGWDEEAMFIVVKGFDEVDLMLAADMKTKIRQHPVRVKLDKHGKTFPFGQFLEVDNFIILISTLFEETEDLVKIRQYVSRLTITDSIDTADDGISQSANIKRGVSGALADTTLAPLGLKLKPWRTFVEVDQPESSFVFRMKLTGDKIPLCAILESDGGAWKAAAAKSIKEWLENNIKEVDVIA